MTANEFWQAFLAANNKDPSTECFESFYFCADKQSANGLLSLVLAGKKRATTSCLAAYELDNEALPKAGDYSIVTDWDGDPACVIETTAVTVLPFNEVTCDICKREGEDECLETWQEGHRHFFTEEGRQLGYQFTETTPVVFEDFEVVHQRMPLSLITACGECCVGCKKKDEGL